MAENNENSEQNSKENTNKEDLSAREKTPQETEKNIYTTEIEEKMKSAYLDYSMSVIIGRALPDIRDGLKPVHRRILFAMNEMGMFFNKPFKKSARIVGEVLGKLHPHGDTAVYDSMVRMAQPWSLRYLLIDGQGNFGCFTKDTKVSLTDGRDLSFCELVKEHKKGKKNYTYTVNKNGDIEISAIKNPRLTKKNQRILKIVLDNNKEIKCTLNHRFMLRDGTYKEAQHLKPGDSLMPLYLKLSIKKEKFKPALRGYQLVYQPETNVWIPAHNLADAWNLKNDVYKKNSGRIRHHIDFNKLNNNPDNVRRIKWKDHWKFHAEHASELHKNKDYRKKIAEGRKKFWSDPKNRMANSKRLSERNKKNWANQSYRKKMSKFLSKMNKEYIRKHPEKRIEFSKRATKVLKKLWNDPEYRKKKSDALKEKWKDPKYRAEQAERTRKRSLKIWSNPKHREYISNLNKERWKDKKYKEKMINAYKNKWKNDPEFRRYFLKIFSENGKKANYCRFLTVCKKTIKLYGNLNEKNYEKSGVAHNSRKGAGIIKFNIALNKFFDGDIKKLYRELKINTIKLNHKVKRIILLNKRENVYDLTIDKTHNFALASGVFVHNSIDGDSAAAMRYSEARLTKLAGEMLTDIDKETVDFVPNFDGSLKEPTVLPSKPPNLLINGSSGIAVGMATNIPPHNLREVCNGVIAFIDNPQITVDELMDYIKAPDFPTGGSICGLSGVKSAFHTGRGKLTLRAKAKQEEKKNKISIIITEIPYQVNKSMLIEQIAGLVKNKSIEGISDIRDESDRDGMRIVIELKQSASYDIVLNQLYKHTRLQTTFGIIFLSLVNNEPKVLNLKKSIEHFVDHRKDVIIRRTTFDLKKAEDTAHILEGLITALDHIDEVIKKIKASRDAPEASKALMESYSLTEKQAKAILEMRLQKLASLEQQKIKDEHAELLKLITKLKSILASEQRVLEIIKDELKDISEKYGDDRRTDLIEGEFEEIDMEDLIEPEDMVVTKTHYGYIKRIAIDTYRQQKRGGKGVIATTTKDEDFIEDIFVANTHDYLLFFTNKGKVHWLKVYKIPEGSRQAKGSAIVNFLDLEEGEKVTAYVPVSDFSKGFLAMATRKGLMKKCPLLFFKKPRKGGIIAITLEDDDELISVKKTDGERMLMLASRNGKAVKFKEEDVRPMGRAARGVRAIKLFNDDFVVGMVVAVDTKDLFTITENGYGKRTIMSEYRLINRGGSGVINIQTSERNGKVIDVKSVYDDNDLMFISQKGIVIRVSAGSISRIGRNTQGVRLMNLGADDRVVSAAKIKTLVNNRNNNSHKPKDTPPEDKPKTDVEEQEELKEEEEEISKEEMSETEKVSEHAIRIKDSNAQMNSDSFRAQKAPLSDKAEEPKEEEKPSSVVDEAKIEEAKEEQKKEEEEAAEIDEDVYDKKSLEEQGENSEIEPQEEAFMEGYNKSAEKDGRGQQDNPKEKQEPKEEKKPEQPKQQFKERRVRTPQPNTFNHHPKRRSTDKKKDSKPEKVPSIHELMKKRGMK